MVATLSIATLALLTQSQPVDIPAKDLPKLAHCVVCEAGGSNHGEEKPAAGVRFEGKDYYFCNKKEVAVFRKDPASYLPPVLPRPMPAFELTDTAGVQWNAASMKEKVVLIDFWATWCAPCKEMKPILEKVDSEFAARSFEVLSVSIDEKKADFDKFLKKNKFSNPVLWDDTNAWSAWKVRVVPSFFVVKDGQIVAQWVGKKKLPEVKAIIEPWLPK